MLKIKIKIKNAFLVFLNAGCKLEKVQFRQNS